MATGDIAEMDADSCLYLRGLVRSVINVGGLKCFPEEVEAVLCSHPGVKSARVAARAHLAIELRRLCQELLSAYKVPVFYTFVCELPLTASGKLRRG